MNNILQAELIENIQKIQKDFLKIKKYLLKDSIKSGSVSKMLFFISYLHGCSVKTINRFGGDILVYAILNAPSVGCRLEMVDILLRLGASPNHKCITNGITPIIASVIMKDVKVYELLLFNGALFA